MFSKLKAQRKARQKASADSFYLYEHLVTHARSSRFYLPPFNVKDSVEGRFELILVHLFIIDFWLSRSEKHILLRRALQELLITDIDRSLREMGVGDMSVGKQMKNVGAALLGRLQSYKLAFESDDEGEHAQTKVAEIMSRNIAGHNNSAASNELASYMVWQIEKMAEQDPKNWTSEVPVFSTDDSEQGAEPTGC